MIKLLKTPLEMAKTMRNVGRLKEIVSVFAKNGFDEFISRGVTSVIPDFVLPKSTRAIKTEVNEDRDLDWNRIFGRRLKKCFEELGPSFIKFGQLLSSREDVFAPGFVDELKGLRDKVKPIPFKKLKKQIEKGIGRPFEEVFKDVVEAPIGMASIGVVYKATLINNEEVVIKVKRPNIERVIETDLSLFHFVITQMEKVSEEVRFLGLSRVIRDFSISLHKELNFSIELLNCKRLKKNLEVHDKEKIFYLPKVYEEYSSKEVLVMEFLDGIPFSDDKKVRDLVEEIQPKLEKGIVLFFKTFLEDGLFHADLHGGNFFYLKDKRMGLIDFGLMGTLSQKGRRSFIAIIYSILNFDFDNLVYEFLDVAEYEKIPDVDSLVNDVRDGIAPFIGLTVKQTEFNHVLNTIIATLKKYEIYLPREWFSVFRAFITLDGVGKSLGIDLDLFSLLEGEIEDLVKSSYSKESLIEEGVWAGKDLLTSVRIIPRHIKWFLKEISKRGYAFEIIHKGHEQSFDKLSRAVTFMGLSIFSSVLLMSGVLLLDGVNLAYWREYPFLVWPFFGAGVLTFIKAVRKL
jgi:ubiquinone biosynthesis protein